MWRVKKKRSAVVQLAMWKTTFPSRRQLVPFFWTISISNISTNMVVAGSTLSGESGRVPLRVAQSIKMLSKKKKIDKYSNVDSW
jgi:hypothetical protein